MRTGKNTRTFIAVIYVILVVSGCAPTSHTTPRATQKVDIIVTNHGTGTAVSDSLIGFSIELAQTCAILQDDDLNSVVYEQLYKNLGSSVLHIGGHSADRSFWEPNGITSCKTVGSVVTTTLLEEIFAFARKINWKVIWTLNLLDSSPSIAAAEAAAVVAAGGASLAGFTIGNEPDLYVKWGFRPQGWGYADYYTEWQNYRDAILRAVPSARFFGPDTCCATSFFPSFALDASRDRAMSALTQHYYTRDAKAGGTTAAFILSRKVAQQFETFVGQLAANASDAGLPLDITESNSISSGGVQGVSDTLAAALWASDYLLQAALLGVHQIDFSEAPKAFYNAIDDNGMPTPLYYALLLVHHMTEQARIMPIILQTPLNLSAYAIIDASGQVSVIVVNKEMETKTSLNIYYDQSENTAELIRLQGPNIAAKSDITLGGRAVSAMGTWTPDPEILPIKSKLLTLTVPAASVAVVTFSH
jgi:hypothetical protein